MHQRAMIFKSASQNKTKQKVNQIAHRCNHNLIFNSHIANKLVKLLGNRKYYSIEILRLYPVIVFW